MRIRNKELKRRWRRKEDKIKELRLEAIAGAKSGGKAKVAKAEKPAKPAAKPAAKAPKAAATDAAAKPKKAPAKKKAE